MKLFKIVLLFSLTVSVSWGLQSCASAHKNVASPMTNEELQYFKKYIGKWGGSTWTHFDGLIKARDRTIEITIQKIDAKKRKASLTYFLEESADGHSGVTVKRRADCIGNKIIFSTKNFNYEFVLQGEYLRAARKGLITQETFLKRIEKMAEER